MTTRSRVRWLGGLLIAHGIAQLGATLFASLALIGNPDGPGEQDLAVVIAGLALFVAVAALQIAAGWWNLDVRRRALGFVASATCLVCSLSLCCPLSLLVGAFGIWVLVDQDVARAFRRRADGASAEDALADRAAASELAAVFDLDDDLDPERRALDQDVAEALIAILPDDWDEAYLDLRRSPDDARLTVVIRDGTGDREIRPDSDLLDVLGALDEYVQASGGFLLATTLYLRDANGWRYEWQE